MPHFCSPCWTPFRGCRKSAAAAAHDLILVEVDGKCQWKIPIHSWHLIRAEIFVCFIPLYLQCLEQYLIHSKCLIHICRMKKDRKEGKKHTPGNLLKMLYWFLFYLKSLPSCSEHSSDERQTTKNQKQSRSDGDTCCEKNKCTLITTKKRRSLI